MEVKILEQKENHLLRRKEVSFSVVHKAAATPKQHEVRNKLAALLGAESNLTVIDDFHSPSGTNTASGFAKIYKNAEEMRRMESSKIVEKQFGEKKPKAAAEVKPKAKAEEKPKDEKKA